MDIYAYTYSGANEHKAGWTPMIFRLRDVLYEEYDKEISDKEKKEKIRILKEPSSEEDFIEME